MYLFYKTITTKMYLFQKAITTKMYLSQKIISMVNTIKMYVFHKLSAKYEHGSKDQHHRNVPVSKDHHHKNIHGSQDHGKEMYLFYNTITRYNVTLSHNHLKENVHIHKIFSNVFTIKMYHFQKTTSKNMNLFQKTFTIKNAPV